MSERLYLIRVNFSKLIGPFNQMQLQEAHKNMRYGLQDEICGNLGDWVTFDDTEGIKREYPELYTFVKEGLLAGWGVTHKPEPIKPGLDSKQYRPRRIWLIPAIILAILFGIGLALLQVSNP